MRKALVAMLLALLTHTAQADFNDGVVALMMGKFDQALETFVPLAESQDHAYAQYFLGRMYAAGQGVEQNAQTAAEWYRKAAEQGVGDAQYRLGEMYESGTGVPPDMEYAYGWYSVSAHVGNAKGADAFARAKTMLSSDELVEAEKLSREFIQKFGEVPKSTSRQQ